MDRPGMSVLLPNQEFNVPSSSHVELPYDIPEFTNAALEHASQNPNILNVEHNPSRVEGIGSAALDVRSVHPSTDIENNDANRLGGGSVETDVAKAVELMNHRQMVEMIASTTQYMSGLRSQATQDNFTLAA